MRTRPCTWLSLAALLAACGAPPPAAPLGPSARALPARGAPPAAAPLAPQLPLAQPPGPVPLYHLAAVGPLVVARVEVDSELTTTPKGALVDGNLGTAWSPAGYRPAIATATLELAGPASVRALALKQPPSPPGTSYDVLTSLDGQTWTPVLSNQTASTWNLETKHFPAPVSARAVRLLWRNSASAPIPRPAIYEVALSGEAGPPTSPAPGASTPPSPLPSPLASTAPQPSPLASTAPSPAASASPGPIPVGVTPHPGPRAARGQCLVNGVGVAGISLKLVNRSGAGSRSVTTDAQGYFSAFDLPSGDYYAHYYNASDRNKIGYWISRPQKVDAASGAAFPPVDLFQKGMTNTPRMDYRGALPLAFSWVPQTQRVNHYWFRVHTRPFTSFELMYQSGKIDGTASTYTWDGSGAKLPFDPKNRYFWGVQWDAGPIGQGGNLYQAIYFNR